MITKLKAALAALEEAQRASHNIGMYLHGVPQSIEPLRTVIAQLEQVEPVAWTVAGDVKHWGMDFSKYQTQHYVRPVFAAPVQPVREVLTDDQLLDEYCITPNMTQFVIAFNAGARFAELHHGITKD